MKSLYFIGFVMIFQLMNAQRSVSTYTYNVDSVGGVSSFNFTEYGITEDELNNASGSPYLNKEFAYGTISVGDKEIASILRYNIFFDEIEISKVVDPDDKTNIGGLLKDPSIKAKFDNRTFVYISSGNEGGYVQILTTGKQFDLYMKSTVTYTPPYYSTNGYDTPRPGKFETTNAFYMVSKQNRFIPIPTKHKDLLKMISYKQAEVKKYLKDNRIKLSKENDVKKFMVFYNNLQG